MPSVYLCLVDQHQPSLVLLAITICLLTATGGLVLLRHAHQHDSDLWALVAGVSTGFGVWAMHFVAMLGYMPGLDMSYRPGLTAASLAVAVLGVTAGLIAALRFPSQRGIAAAACIAGGSVAAMHYIGASALNLPARMVWQPVMVVGSVVMAVGLLYPALRLALGRDRLWQACLLLSLGVTSLHFTGMAAFTLIPQRMAPHEGLLLMPETMSALVGLATCLVLLSAMVALLLSRRAAAAIHSSERAFSILVEGISDCALYMLTNEGRIAYWNPGAERLKGYSGAEAIGLPLSCFYTLQDRAAGLPERALSIATTQGKFTSEGWRCRKDGSQFWAHVTIERIFDKDGAPLGFAKITRDMTRLKEEQDGHAAMRAQLNTALDNMHQGLALFDSDHRLVLANSRLCAMWGIPQGMLLPGTGCGPIIEQLMEGQRVTERSAIRSLLEQALHTADGQRIMVECHGDFHVGITSRALEDGGRVVTFEDVTERRRNEARIAHLAAHDPLTGLPNRARFNEWCGREMPHAARHGRHVAVVALDLDRFKEINDRLGHAAGDRAIIEAAQRLTAACREGEIVARLGGDEFAAACLYDSQSELSDFVERLSACFRAHESDMPLRASFGVAIFPEDGRDRETLLNNADLAMLRAKTSRGEAICYYEQGMDEHARTRRRIAGDLHNALEHDELCLFYQPQHAIRSGALTGYEALVRWRHPLRGMIPPLDFIPVAEETGAIFAIGEWVLRRAARDAARWASDIKVAVNVSPVQLQQPDLAQRIAQILIDTGLPAHRLELEITESAIIADKARALHVLRQIKALGIAIAMDDFGTGYASLETLHAFPFDKLKIDKSLLHTAAASPQGAAIMRTVLALGRSLEIPVLCEGVETEDQLDLLRREGCDEGQGYLFGYPKPLAGVSPATAISRVDGNRVDEGLPQADVAA
ncbi:bifunctional diguanylate cyclase/phosphodiesterase [Novosphingobium terrae]|uniref:bifunctional diguanylate cyclase/phosphodiesterase n=1 Tax=Novosphingobium terrae TaxID=2726189 RepID=UPI00197FBEF2|nr:EAL domain-containing protein [Novosphingobium terrae]